MRRLMLVLIALWVIGTVCCSTVPTHPTGVPLTLQPDTRHVNVVRFTSQVLNMLQAEWRESDRTRKERGGCVQGYFSGDTLYVEEAIPALFNAGAAEDRVYLVQQLRCYGTKHLGFYHTHIIRNQFAPFFSIPDANSRFGGADAFSVVVWRVEGPQMAITFGLSTGYVEHVTLNRGGR